MKIEPIYTSKANSILLKQKGFDVECPSYYLLINDYTKPIETNTHTKNTNDDGWCSSPEHWVVCEYFKQVHGIWVSIGRNEDNKYFYEIDFHSITYGDDDEFDTPYEATEAAINYVLTNLI